MTLLDGDALRARRTVAGGPFQVDGKAGSRAYVFLSGTQAALKGLVAPIP